MYKQEKLIYKEIKNLSDTNKSYLEVYKTYLDQIEFIPRMQDSLTVENPSMVHHNNTLKEKNL